MQRNVFVSHAHADNVICEEIATTLRQHGIDVWIDLHDAQKGVDLSDDITRQLDRRSVFVLLVTAASNASRWVSMELSNYIALYNDRDAYIVNGTERMILPVRLDPVAIPARLRGFNWIDGVNKPVAQVVGEIARALGIIFPTDTRQPPAPSLSPPAQQFHIPMRMVRLGFVGAVINGVEVIVPPVCDVPVGTFTMGSDRQHDPQARDNEIPQYDIYVPSFQIGTYALTVAEYACAVQEGAAKQPQTAFSVTWQIQLQRPDHPVVCLTWQQARIYAAWLTKITGHLWRLPTEAEWEKAARGTDGRIYPWGNQWDKTKANTTDDGPQMTTSVGAYAEKGDASPYGAHDLAGNVWEWTSSAYLGEPPYRADQAEKEAGTTSDRVLRGGSWDLNQRDARSASRSLNNPDLGLNVIGVRLVRSLEAGK